MLSCHSSGPIYPLVAIMGWSNPSALRPPDTTVKTQRCLHVFWQIQLLHTSIVGDQLCPKLLGPLGPLGLEWISSKSMGNCKKSMGKLENPPLFQRRTCLPYIFHCVSEPAKLRKKKKCCNFPALLLAGATFFSGRSREWNL